MYQVGYNGIPKRKVYIPIMVYHILGDMKMEINMNGTPFCLGCKKELPDDVKQKESWICSHCGSREYDFGIKENHKSMATKKDIVCPDCKGMLDDVFNSKHLFCQNCHIEWRV